MNCVCILKYYGDCSSLTLSYFLSLSLSYFLSRSVSPSLSLLLSLSLSYSLSLSLALSLSLLGECLYCGQYIQHAVCDDCEYKLFLKCKNMDHFHYEYQGGVGSEQTVIACVPCIKDKNTSFQLGGNVSALWECDNEQIIHENLHNDLD